MNAATHPCRLVLLLLLGMFAGVTHAAPPIYDASSSPWQFADGGTFIGYHGFYPVEANGGTELLIATNRGFGNINNAWQVLRWDPDTQKMRLAYASNVAEEVDDEVELLRLLDINGDGREEIIIGRQGGRLEVYDKESRALLGAVQLQTNLFTDAAVADIDNDGKPELLLLTLSTLHIVDGLENFPNGQLRESYISDVGGYRFAIGQLDQDAPLEILFSWGGILEVGTWKLEWNLGDVDQSFIMRGLIDRNGDGISEILVTKDDNVIALDLATKTETWRAAAGMYLADKTFRMRKLGANSAPELIFGGNKVVTMDSATGEIKYSASLPYSSYFLDFVDVDHDGTDEIAYSSEWGSVTPDQERLVIAHKDDLTPLWQGYEFSDYYKSPRLGDVDGDGRPELVIDGRGLVTLVDPITSQPFASFEHSQSLELFDVKDVDGDGRCEILLGGRPDYYSSSRQLKIYRYADGEFSAIWEKTVRDPIYPDAYNRYMAASMVDLNGDGILEIVAGWTLATGLTDTKASGIEVFNFADGALVWGTPRQFATLNTISVGNFDRDPALEVAALLDGKWLRIWDLATHKQQFKLRGDFTAIVPVANGFVTGHKTGYVSRFATRKRGAYARVSHRLAATTPISGITPEADGASLWLATADHYIWFPADATNSFTIQGDGHEVPPNVALYSGTDGSWLYASFLRNVRGFPLDP